MVSEAMIRAIHCTITLQNLGDGVPVRVVHLNAMCLHPVLDGFLCTLHYIAYRMQVLPECHLEAAAYALSQTYGTLRRQERLRP